MVIKYLSTEDKHSRVLWDKRCHQGITLGSQTEAQMLPSSGTMSCLNQARTLPILVVWDSHLLRFVYLGLCTPNNVFHCCYPIFKKPSYLSNIHHWWKSKSETILVSTEQKHMFCNLLEKHWRRTPEDCCRELQTKSNSIWNLITMHLA